MQLIVYLVHGTWPRGPLPGLSARLQRMTGRVQTEPFWFEPGSDLRNYLTRELPGVEFVDIDWSGRNTFSARSAAAEKLRNALRSRISGNPNALHVVLAHSHGGNIAVEALRDLDPQLHPAGIATMGTPFLVLERRKPSPIEVGQELKVAIRRRIRLHSLEQWTFRGSLLVWLFCALNLLMALTYSAFNFLASRAVGLLGKSAKLPAFLGEGLPIVLFFAVGIVVIAAMSPLMDWANRLRAPSISAHRRVLRRLRCRLPRGFDSERTSLLVIRSPGDEASLALASASAFASISRGLWGLFTAPVKWLIWPLVGVPARIALRYYGYIYLVLFVIIAVLVSYGRGTQLGDYRYLPSIVLGLVAMFIVPFSLPFVSIVLAGIIIPPLFFLSALLLVPFGFELVALAPLVSAHAETALPGTESRLVMVPGSEIRRGMRHSLHVSRSARVAFADWVKSLVRSAASR